MKKNTFHLSSLSVALFLSSQLLMAQPTPEWVATYNGFGKSDQAREIVVDAQGFIYVAGASDPKQGLRDYAVVKYNSAKDQKAVGRYNGTGNGDDYVNGIAVDVAGNIYLTGFSEGIGSGLDYATVKFDGNGNLIWARRYSGATNTIDVGKDVKVDISGNVYVTGQSGGTSTVNGSAITTIKYGPLGDILWTRHYDGFLPPSSSASQESGQSLTLDNDGNVYVTGESGGNLIVIKYSQTGAEEWVRTVAGGGSGRKILFDGTNIIATGWGSKTVKFSTSGLLIWESTYVGAGAAFWDMALDALGNTYVTGYTRESGTTDYMTVKYNVAGEQQWAAKFNGSFNGIDMARGIAIDASSNVYVTGYCTLKDGSRNGMVSFATIKYNISGEEKWVAYYNRGQGFGIALDATGAIYVAGEVSNKTNVDFLTIKYVDGASTRTTSTSLLENSMGYELRNYPNPFRTNTTIAYQLAKEGEVSITVYDLLGHQVANLVNEWKPAGRHQVSFSAANLPAGTYLFKMQSGDHIETKRLIVEK